MATQIQKPAAPLSGSTRSKTTQVSDIAARNEPTRESIPPLVRVLSWMRSCSSGIAGGGGAAGSVRSGGRSKEMVMASALS